MRTRFLVLAILVFANTSARAAVISDRLQGAMSGAGNSGFLGINITMASNLDQQGLLKATKNMNRIDRRAEVVSRLQAFSASSQGQLRSLLASLQANGTVRNVRILWIANAVSCEATAGAILKMDKLPGLRLIDLDEESFVLIDEESDVPGYAPVASDTVWGVKKINAPQVWAQGYTGSGVVVGVLDTGVNYHHADLADHIWVNTDEMPGNSYDDDKNGYVDDVYGYDFHNRDGDPIDDDGHGTHCAGTVAGDGTAGLQTGVAPDARVMSLKVLDNTGNGKQSNAWEAIQYAITNNADVISMSIGWIHTVHNPDRHTWRIVCGNAYVAGLALAAAAGNERITGSPAPDNIRTPADVPPPWLAPAQTLKGGIGPAVTVGATDTLDAVASFSSYGPVDWSGISPWFDYPYDPEIGLIDPDVCAPGTHITSLNGFNNNAYEYDWDGTSMAAPHVAGTIALMLSKNWTLDPAAIDSILETTALDRGPAGKDNDYGAGRIDAYQAALATPIPSGPNVIFSSCMVNDSAGGNADGKLDPGETGKLIVNLVNNGVGNATNVKVTLRTHDTHVAITDSTSNFGDIAGGGGKADNLSDPLTVTATPATPKEWIVPFELRITCNEKSWTREFSLMVGKILTSDPSGPDAYGYFAYDMTDVIFSEVPHYDWLEIDTIGTNLNLTDEACTTLTLPFTFKYYGWLYTQITVSSNGWLCMGLYTSPEFGNTPIPDPGGPPAMVAFIWDDMNPSGERNAYYYEDNANGRVIVEYDGVYHFGTTSPETVQVILYDPDVDPTVSGDGEIVLQYKSPVSQDDATIGIEDHLETRGIQFFYEGGYDRAAAPITDRYAVKFTPDPPETVLTPYLLFAGSRVVDTLTGDGDSLCDPGETVDLVLYIENAGAKAALGASAILRTADPFITVVDSTAAFGDISPFGGMSVNESNPFVISADLNTPLERRVAFELEVTSDGGTYIASLSFDLTIGTILSVDPIGPDDYGYYCYDNTDTRYTECPTYFWIAVDSTQSTYPGVPLDIPDDGVKTVRIPFAFKYYAEDYDSLTVSSNGWICMGRELSYYTQNYPIPSSQGPSAMIAGVWDDLDPGNPGQKSEIYYYYDSTAHIFIIEFFEVEHYPHDLNELFEFVLYDPAYEPTHTGDGEIIINYARGIQQNDITVGIEDSTETTGIQYFYEGGYSKGAAVLGSERSLKFTTDPPIVGTEEKPDRLAGRSRFYLSQCVPNPSRQSVNIAFEVDKASYVSLKVYNCLGQSVKTLVNETMQPGQHGACWDGRDEHGRMTASGIYFLRLESAGNSASRKLVCLR